MPRNVYLNRPLSVSQIDINSRHGVHEIKNKKIGKGEERLLVVVVVMVRGEEVG